MRFKLFHFVCLFRIDSVRKLIPLDTASLFKFGKSHISRKTKALHRNLSVLRLLFCIFQKGVLLTRARFEHLDNILSKLLENGLKMTATLTRYWFCHQVSLLLILKTENRLFSKLYFLPLVVWICKLSVN